jgi:hypothetical protein
MMTLSQTLEASQTLRRYTGCFERCTKGGKDIEARTYLPNIKKACEELGMDWRAVVGLENERFFKEPERFSTEYEPFSNRSVTVQYQDKNPEITVQTDINRSCGSCGNSLKGKRSNAKYCNEKCKNQART